MPCRAAARSAAIRRGIRAARTGLLLSAAAALLACSTHRVPLRYAPVRATAVEPAAQPLVVVGRFVDERDTDSDWLGAIRGGYGNALKRLRTEAPTADVVEAAFRDALVERGLHAAEGEARYELSGRIRKLDCSYYVNREAHTHFDVQLVELVDGSVVHEDVYFADLTEPGVGAGIFGSVDGLRELAERTLSVAIDQVLADPAFLRALQEGPGSTVAEEGDPADRLRRLEELRDQGLIDESEYEAKRREILDSL